MQPSTRRTYEQTKFSVATIRAAYNVFLESIPENIRRDELVYRRLDIIRGGDTRNMGDTEAFFKEYRSQVIEGAVLDSGRKGSGFNFLLEFMSPDSSVEIELPDIESVNKVFGVFEGSITDSAAQVSVIEESALEESRKATVPPPPPKTPPSPPDGSPPTEDFNVKVKALADGVSKIDLLDYEVYAQALVDFIASGRTGKPLTVGIDAAWGMGKTTLMTMMEERLKPDFRTVWFNAWKYDQEETLWSALILETLDQIRKDLTWFQRVSFAVKLNFKRFNWGKLLRIILQNLLGITALFVIAGVIIYLGISIFWPKLTFQAFISKVIAYPAQIGILAAFTLFYKVIKEVQALVTGPFNLKITEYLKNPDYQEHVGFLEKLTKDFEILLDLITDRGGKPLVIFIDDLDRCAPPNPVAIFEAINLILGAKHCVFIIGMDSRTVAGSIEARYKDIKHLLEDPDDPGGLTLGERFIEKIVQINFKIPKSDQEKTVKTFIDRSLEEQAAPAEVETKEMVEKAEEFIQREMRAGVIDVAEAVNLARSKYPEIPPNDFETARQNIFVKEFNESDAIAKAIHTVSPYLESNPRKIKKFINLFRLKAFIANRRELFREDGINLTTLAYVVIFEMRWPKVVEAYMTDESFIKTLQKLKKIRQEMIDSQGDPNRWPEIEKKLESIKADPIAATLIGADDLFELMVYLPKARKLRLVYFQLNIENTQGAN